MKAEVRGPKAKSPHFGPHYITNAISLDQMHFLANVPILL